MQGWREKLVELEEAIDTRREDAREVVRTWVKQVDLLTGRILRRTNHASDYWLFGEGDGSVQGLLSNDYGLNRYAEPHSYTSLPEEKYETVSWWSSKVDHSFLVSRLQGHPFSSHEGINALAKWWDAYAYWSAISYAVWRYDDDLFSKEIQDGLHALWGEMLSRRFEVCFASYGSKEEEIKLELFMLNKLKAFKLLLRDESKSWTGKRYFEKKFPGYALLERIGKMNAKDLKDLFEKEQKRKWNWERTYHQQKEAKKEKKESGIIGPLVKEDDACLTPEKTTTSTTTKKRTSGKGSPTPAVKRSCGASSP